MKTKENLVQFVDEAIEYGHLLPSKRGRKTRFITPKDSDAENPPEVPNSSNKVRIAIPHNWKRTSKEENRAEFSGSSGPAKKNSVEVKWWVPETMEQQHNPLVLTYPMPIPVSFPGLYGMYQLPAAIPYSSIPVCLSILNKQYY